MSDSTLPPLYARWLKAEFEAPITAEPDATCDDCAMCATDSPEPADLFFDPSTKCCTFIPSLPNYLVGAILQDHSQEASAGRASIERRILRRKAVTPLGLGRTLGFSLRYKHNKDAFGRLKSLRCPHYVEEGGLCSIWRYRNATCSTWFCKHSRGFTGLEFWRALHQLLAAVERNLGAWCVHQLDMVNEEVLKAYAAGDPPLWNTPSSMSGHLLGNSMGSSGARPSLGLVSARKYAQLWGDWQGREPEFYERCFERVAELDWSDVQREIGEHIQPQLEAFKAAHQKHQDQTLPSALQHRPAQVVRIGEGLATVANYSVYDPLQLPQALLKALACFDGRPTATALEAIAEEHGLELSDALLRKLVDHRLLEAPKY